MQLRQSQRQHASIKMALQGPSNSGKTMSALLLAYGLTQSWQKIAVIDTENNSADLYAHIGNFNVLSLSAPFTPERYTEALQTCVKAEMQVVIIDSLSHEWYGTGGILNIHAGMIGNSFTNWGKITPRHNAFIQELLQSELHIIATLRTKQDYILTEKNGKQVLEKIGLKVIQRNDIEYEFDLVFNLDSTHHATVTKDRTGLFHNQSGFKITPKTGKAIYQWCSTAVDADYIRKQIQQAANTEDLTRIYNQYPTWYTELQKDFNLRKQQLQPMQQPIKNIINTLKISTNGTHPNSSTGYHRN